MMSTFAIAILSIALSVAAQFVLKTGMADARTQAALTELPGAAAIWAVASHPFVAGGFALYGVGAIVWLKVLAQWDVSKAYPLVGLGFCLTLLVGWLSGEAVSASRVAGALLICAGVLLISRT